MLEARLATLRPAASGAVTGRPAASRSASMGFAALRMVAAGLAELRTAGLHAAAAQVTPARAPRATIRGSMGAQARAVASGMAVRGSRNLRTTPATPRRRASAPAPLPPLAPSLGPEPFKCGIGCWGDQPGSLAVSYLADVDVSPKIVKVGDFITARIHMFSSWSPKGPVSGFEWPIPGCGKRALVCRWKATPPPSFPAPTGQSAWQILSVPIDNSINNALSQDYYATTGDITVLDGFVRDDEQHPITNTTVLISGPRSWRAITNLNGHYTAILPKGTYTVTPQVDPTLMNPGEHVKPVASADCAPSGSSCIVQLDKNRTANFIVPGCRIKPETILGWKIDGRCPQHPEDGATGVKITPPASLAGLAAQLPTGGFVTHNSDGTDTLNYALPMQDRTQLYLPVELPDLSFSVGGVSLSAYGVAVSDDGLAVDTLGFTAGQVVGTINNLFIGGDHASADELDVTADGAGLEVQGVQISAGSVSAASGTIILPDILGGATATVSGFGVDAGGVHGTLTGASLQLGDFFGAATDVALTDHGFTVGSAELHLDMPGSGGCTVEIHGLVYDGQSVTFSNAAAQINLTVGNMQVSGQVSISPHQQGNTLELDFSGTVNVHIPNVFNAQAAFEMGSADPSQGHCSRLWQLHFQAEAGGGGVPLGSTNLTLTGLSGGLDSACDHAPAHGATFTITLGAGLQTTVDAGALFKGTLQGAMATDGNFGVGVTNATLLRVIQVTGGLCARLNAGSDTVCQTVLPNLLVPSPAAMGLYITAHGDYQISLPLLRKLFSAGLDLDLYGKIERPAGQAAVVIEAGVTGTITLAAGSYFGSAQLGGQMGQFAGAPRSGMGIKLTFSAVLRDSSGHSYNLSRSLFIDDQGNVTSSGVNTYQLLPPTSMRVPRLAGLPQAAALQPQPAAAAAGSVTPTPTSTPPSATPLPSATPAPPPVVGIFRIPRGQSDTLFSLSWQSGAPTLTLVTPGGRRITPQQPGPGAFLVGGSATNTITLYLPHPTAGSWQVRVGNLHGGEGWSFTMDGNAPQPKLSISSPRRGQTLLGGLAHPRVALAGQLRGGPDGTLALYATTAPTVGRRTRQTPDYAGTRLAAAVPVRKGVWRYNWDTSALPAGRYYVYAVLNNGTGPLIAAYGGGAILVRQPARPGGPRAVRAVRRGPTLAVQWAPPAQAALVAGYLVRYRAIGGPWTVDDVGIARSVVVSGLLTGTPYAVAVATYDVMGHQSGWVAGGVSVVRLKPAPPRPTHRRKHPRPHALSAAGTGPVQSGTDGAAAVPVEAPAEVPSTAPLANPNSDPTGVAPVWTGTAALDAATVSRQPAAASCPRTPADPKAIAVFCITDDPSSGTPQIADNDAAGIAGLDPNPQAVNRFHAPGNAETVANGQYVQYKSDPAHATLTYIRYDPRYAGNVAAQNDLIRAHRKAACGTRPFLTKGRPGPPGAGLTSCDEFPFASTDEGGAGAIIRGVVPGENNVQGGQFSAFVKQYAVNLKNNGGKFKVCVMITHGIYNRAYGAC
ncbi:MAG TPA: NucA/NucB deoxyribonuclease domain-containing protein [Chloroflexota bacterium]|nr:NucA/NucB deoxyribonuclease domain-containing protein [Chloroflexota bacterium]